MRASSLTRLFLIAVATLLALVVIAPGCGRSSLEPELLTSGDASVPPGTCGPSTCPNGCCDAQGVCRNGSDTRACGDSGRSCNDCISQGYNFCEAKVCGRNVDRCDETTCPTGCCSSDRSGNRVCLAGVSPGACGTGAAQCVNCGAEGRSCDPFTRACSATSCDASNCKGCCVGDQCLTGNDDTSCGSNGEACATCRGGQTCEMSAGGFTCEGEITCNAGNCSGCCQPDGTCLLGADTTACGQNGEACVNCAQSGGTCVPLGQPSARTCQAKPACNAETCAGCCRGDECVIATTPAACGARGEACRTCGNGETCNSGVCEPGAACGPQNCNGCCIGDICAAGSQNTACGLNGAQCANCTGQGGRVCQGGTCQQPACGPGNCAGCCSGNTCVVGTQDNACGPTNGQQCSDCAAGNQICQNRVCVDRCGPTNCAGCCQGNACAPGVARGACGSGGAQCANCNVQGSVCDVAQTPRVCSGNGTCPAAYPSCPNGVTTPVTPSLQNRCSSLDLDALQSACAAGPTSGTCVQAFQVIAITNAACATCMTPFNQPFTELGGLYRCAAPFVSATCNRASGCAVDCANTSCDGCPAANEDQCRAQANGNGGQCSTYVQQTNCVAGALGPGQLCSPLTYAGSFGNWLRAVGAHFCGNGP